jgi:hypothetical protein
LVDVREIREELFRLEYPQLLAGSDPDIERYCYLRASGQGRAALSIYQLHIKPRYPDDILRMALLRAYRSRDPLYPRLLAAGYRRLAERALERVRRIIDYISSGIRTCNPQDVYSTIKTIEDILRFFPREQYEAVSGIDRMYRYAQVMNYQVEPMEQAAEMVRSYLSQSLPVLEKERKRRRQERVRKEKETAPVMIDFSTVVFSPEDIERIEIPSRLARIEDQTLAYCAKYWNFTGDATFEQILFLYSRKYRRKNHSVYLAIRHGRSAGHRDEDILTSVMALLVTGYYYSIQGDRYLQRSWAGIKFAMDRAALAAKNAAPEPVTKPDSRAKPVKPPVPASKPAGATPKTKPVSASGPASKPGSDLMPAPRPGPGPKPPVKPVSGETVREPAVPAAPPKKSRPAAAGKPAPPAPPAEGSVSDRLRKLSGRGYDLYQDRFFAQARPAIRKVLGAGRGLFFNLPEKAEDLVYLYLRDHYADPYMNWAESDEYRQLAEQGFTLPSLNPVIDECFSKIK